MLSDVEFEQLVASAINSLPQEFLDKLNNVDVVIDVWPTQEQLRSVGIAPPQTLFGLYHGTPPTKRRDALHFPDKITIFSGPILNSSTSYEELTTTVQRVVKHEIAHHFCMNEIEISRRGY